MKLQLAQAPTLGLPVLEKPFTQMVDEKHGFMSSVLLQTHGDRLRPVAYFSTKLDAVAAGLPHCLRAVAAAELAVLASREFVGYSDLTLMVPHAVSMILQEQRTSHLSTARWLRYHTILLDMPNVTSEKMHNLNPATLLPTETGWRGTPLLSISLGTGVYTTSRPCWTHLWKTVTMSSLWMDRRPKIHKQA